MPKTSTTIFGIEYSPETQSSKEKCQVCSSSFHTNELRITKTDSKSSGKVKVKLFHFFCLIAKREEYEFTTSGSKLKGIGNISPKHRETVEKALTSTGLEHPADSDDDDPDSSDDDDASDYESKKSKGSKTSAKKNSNRPKGIFGVSTDLKKEARVYKHLDKYYSAGFELRGCNDDEKLNSFSIQIFKSRSNSDRKNYWVATLKERNGNEVVYRTTKFTKASEARVSYEKLLKNYISSFIGEENLKLPDLRENRKSARQKPSSEEEEEDDSSDSDDDENIQQAKAVKAVKIEVDSRVAHREKLQVFKQYNTERSLLRLGQEKPIFDYKIQVLKSNKHASEKKFWVFQVTSENSEEKSREKNPFQSAAEALKSYEQICDNKMRELLEMVQGSLPKQKEEEPPLLTFNPSSSKTPRPAPRRTQTRKQPEEQEEDSDTDGDKKPPFEFE